MHVSWGSPLCAASTACASSSHASRSACVGSLLPGGSGILLPLPQYLARGARANTNVGGILSKGSSRPGGRGKLGAVSLLPSCCMCCWLSCCVLSIDSMGFAAGREQKRASAASCSGHNTTTTAATAAAWKRPRQSTPRLIDNTHC